MKELTIIKIGGNIVDQPAALEEFLKDFSSVPSPKILVHGGGVMASELSAKMGIEVKMQNGRRVTDLDTLKLVTMIYAGWINQEHCSNVTEVRM